MIPIRLERKYLIYAIVQIEAIKRLRNKFSTVEGYIYCIADERKYKRRLTEINNEIDTTNDI